MHNPLLGLKSKRDPSSLRFGTDLALYKCRDSLVGAKVFLAFQKLAVWEINLLSIPPLNNAKEQREFSVEAGIVQQE